MRVAFLGLGDIGAPIASHLAGEPFTLTVWNRTAAKARTFAERHKVAVVATPREAAAAADVVVTCVTSSTEVLGLLDGPDGILAGLRRGALMIDCTSGDPSASREIASILRAWDGGFVDAPVSGGVKGAVAGTLTVMCGAEHDDFERALPVLRAFGQRIVRCGGVGSGHAVKAMNQALLAVHIWSLGEALAILARLGVDAEVALEVINGSSGRSNASDNLFPERVVGRAYPRTFKLALLDKDVAIASQIAREEDIPAPFTELAAELFSRARADLGEDADHVEAVKFIEKAAGVTLG